MATRSLSAYLLLPFLAFPLLLHAQESKVRVKVVADPAVKADKDHGVIKVVKGDAGCVVALKAKSDAPVMGGLSQVRTDWSIWSYASETMALIKSEKPKVVWGEGPVALETIEHFNKQFRLIASKPDPERNVLLIIQQALSPRSLTGKGAQLITEIPYDRLGKGPEYFQSNVTIGFTTVVNTDSTKLLLQLTPASTTRSAGCPVFAMVLDKDMKPLWNYTLQTSAEAKEVKIIDTQVDKSGAVWYLVKNVTNPDPKTKGEIGHTHAIYKLDSAGQRMVPIELPAGDYPVDARFAMRSDGSLSVAGVYSHPDHNRNEVLGVYHNVLNADDLSWGNWKQHLFVNQQVIVKTKPQERLQTDLVTNTVLPKRDGGAYIVAHGSARITTMVSDLSGTKKAKYSWDNWDLHLMELTASGDLKWYKQVERDMTQETDGPGGLICTTYDDLLFVLMNDDEGNYEKRKAKQPVDRLTGCKDATLLEFKADGTEKPRAILQEGQASGCLLPGSVWPVSYGTIATLGTPGFGSEQSFPVLIQMSKDGRK